ncbi:hypothetical protein [Acidianus manzaensis]|uniref:Carbohydrate kinase PfkB domain-containing protein n=1 Tax=Acidianus manzaensis TaxID=282676 RepID=A0A1W6K0G7_9CREN|nr:hypothetical protein [Acidianus manzaensis]ARM76009.1 hypothetical protein B6F84_08220 [Acidianus manzaensis]
MKKISVGVLGAYTIDEIINGNNYFQRAGGAPIYSSLGIYLAGGIPYVFTIKGKDFTFNSPEYVYGEYVDNVEENLRFEIRLEEKGRTLKLKKKIRKMNIDYTIINNLDGIIINPVCNEIDMKDVINISVPIAVDIQGFIRNCIEGEEIKYEKVSFPSSSRYLVIHANHEEQKNSGLSIDELFKLGFKEIIISYGEDGFSVYTKEKTYTMNNDVKGSFEIGDGDFLLGYYFTLRLGGIDIENAVKKAHQMSVKFASYGPNLSILLK